MLRTIMVTSTAIALSLGSGVALADHDRELRYVVGGALLGAALGELVYVSGHRRGHGYYGGYYGGDHGYRYGIAYAPHRYYPRGREFRRFKDHRRFGSRHGYRHRHRHGPHCN